MNIIINDFNIYYEKIGSGKENIIILPGWGNTRPTFNLMIDALKKYYNVYILDYPGFGNSSFPNRNLTIYDYAELMQNFINILDIKEPIVITHSFGTRIALILNAKLKIKFKKLIIIDGAGIKKKKCILLKSKQFLYKLLKKLSIIFPKKFKKLYLKKLVNIFGSADYKSLNDNMKKTFSNIVSEDLSYLLKDISSETLLIWGEKDCDTPLKDGIKMNNSIIDSGLIIIKNGTHFSYLDVPFYVNNIIIEFVHFQ